VWYSTRRDLASRNDRRSSTTPWTGLGSFAAAAVHALDLTEFHLVVYDVGGPVGFVLAARMPERIRSLTVPAAHGIAGHLEPDSRYRGRAGLPPCTAAAR
jgi:pimeloyl-ACP methyl ester carboxylesterase